MNKVRLHNDDFKLSGYENITISSLEDIELKNIDNGELDELIIDNIIDYLPVDKVEDILLALSKKIKKEGKIIISGRDLYEACRAFTNYNINLVEANKLIFGTNTENPFKLGFTLIGLSRYLQEVCQLKILKKRMNEYNYILEATR